MAKANWVKVTPASGSGEFDDDGIAYLNALNTPYISSEFYGTRLAYRGSIAAVDDVEEFKALEEA